MYTFNYFFEKDMKTSTYTNSSPDTFVETGGIKISKRHTLLLCNIINIVLTGGLRIKYLYYSTQENNDIFENVINKLVDFHRSHISNALCLTFYYKESFHVTHM